MKALLKYWVHNLRIVLGHAFDFQVPVWNDDFNMVAKRNNLFFCQEGQFI